MNMYDPNNDPYNYIRTSDVFIRAGNLQTVAFYETERFITNPRFPHLIIGSNGTIYNVVTKMKVHPIVNIHGYAFINVFDIVRNRSVRISVHRLVALSFMPIPNPDEMQVNHKDCNKLNNKLSNLEWVTRSGNMQHAIDNGLVPRKFSDDFIRSICELLNQGMEPKDVIERLGIGDIDGVKTLIYALISRKWFKRILKDYPNIRTKHPRLYNGREYQEYQVRRICELLQSEPDINKVAEQYYQKFGEYIPAAFVLRVKHTIREGQTWWPVVSEYDIRNERFLYNFSDEDIVTLCNMMIQGTSINTVIQRFNLYGKSRRAIKRFLTDLRYNKIKMYYHITSKYFIPGNKVPRLLRDYSNEEEE